MTSAVGVMVDESGIPKADYAELRLCVTVRRRDGVKRCNIFADFICEWPPKELQCTQLSPLNVEIAICNIVSLLGYA